MSAPIEERLATLREEFERGQTLLVEHDTRRERLKESLLRIAGAIQVLEEIADSPESESEINVDSAHKEQERSSP